MVADGVVDSVSDNHYHTKSMHSIHCIFFRKCCYNNTENTAEYEISMHSAVLFSYRYIHFCSQS